MPPPVDPESMSCSTETTPPDPGIFASVVSEASTPSLITDPVSGVSCSSNNRPAPASGSTTPDRCSPRTEVPEGDTAFVGLDPVPPEGVAPSPTGSSPVRSVIVVLASCSPL